MDSMGKNCWILWSYVSSYHIVGPHFLGIFPEIEACKKYRPLKIDVGTSNKSLLFQWPLKKIHVFRNGIWGYPEKAARSLDSTHI